MPNYSSFIKGEQCRLGDQVVTIAIVYEREDDKRSYLIEHSDGSYSRVVGSVLMPLGAEKAVKTKSELSSVAAITSRFYRQPTQRKTILK